MAFRLAHVADIHVRGLHRHAEYRAVFDEFYGQCRRHSVDAIIVCGDIWHTKCQGFTPESIELLSDMFKGMAAVAPTHVMLGNHDLNLQNKSRRDALSPIIDAIDDDRLTLYTGTETVDLTDIDGKRCDLHVFGCADDRSVWESLAVDRDRINIGMFHGSVAGATTDEGWAMDADVTTEFFAAKGLDFTLLGDIHKRQFLTADKRIAYPGSMLPQDFSEDCEKGFLVWEIRSSEDFDVKFVPLKQSIPFVTVDWTGDIASTLEAVKLVPEGARYRVRSTVAMSQPDVKRIHDELKHVKKSVDIAYKIDVASDSNAVVFDGQSFVKDDLRELATHTKLLRHYLGDERFDEDDWEDVDDITTHALADAVARDESSRNSRWSLKKLEFENVFRYGKDNVVDFTRLPGITGIFGPNKSGKSSIIGTLLYTLFNASDRGSVKNLHIINTQKGHCRSRAVIEIDGHEYAVERQSVKAETKRGEPYAVTNLNFARLDVTGDVIEDLNGTERKETDALIRRCIGTVDDFLFAPCAASGGRIRLDCFVSEGSSQRREILSRFMGIDVFERMFESIKAEHDAARSNLGKMVSCDWATELDGLRQESSAIDSEMASLDTELDAQRQKLSELERRLGDAVDSAHIDRLTQQIGRLRQKVAAADTASAAASARIGEIETETAGLESDRASIDVGVLTSRQRLRNDVRQSIADIKRQLAKEEQVLEQQRKSVKSLALVPCGDQYPTCRFIKDSHIDKTNVSAQEASVDVLKKSVVPFEATLVDYESQDIDGELARHSRLSQALASAHMSAADARATLHRAEVDLRDARVTLANAEEALASAVVDDDLTATIAGLRESVRELDARRVSRAQERGRLDGRIEKLATDRLDHEAAQSKWNVYSGLSDAWSRKGLPARLLESQMSSVNVELKRIMQGSSDFVLELEGGSETNALDIYIDDGSTRRLFELASGMERTIGSLALRVALMNISSLPRPDMLIIDEGFGTLDEVNVEAMARMLKGLKHWFKHIVLITHVDALKDAVDNVIEVTRDEQGDSVIKA